MGMDKSCCWKGDFSAFWCGLAFPVVPALWPLRGGRLVCAWVLLLVALTRSYAAEPDRWQCGRPAWATTCGVNLRMKGPKQPPVRPMVPPLEPMRPPLN